MANEHQPVIVRRDGADLAAIIPLEQLELLQDVLTRREAEKIAAELIRTNPDGLARGETLTPEQYGFLLRQITDRLRKSNKLPVRPIPEIRFQAFEGPFYEVLQHRGLI